MYTISCDCLPDTVDTKRTLMDLLHSIQGVARLMLDSLLVVGSSLQLSLTSAGKTHRPYICTIHSNRTVQKQVVSLSGSHLLLWSLLLQKVLFPITKVIKDCQLIQPLENLSTAGVKSSIALSRWRHKCKKTQIK